MFLRILEKLQILFLSLMTLYFFRPFTKVFIPYITNNVLIIDFFEDIPILCSIVFFSILVFMTYDYDYKRTRLYILIMFLYTLRTKILALTFHSQVHVILSLDDQLFYLIIISCVILSFIIIEHMFKYRYYILIIKPILLFACHYNTRDLESCLELNRLFILISGDGVCEYGYLEWERLYRYFIKTYMWQDVQFYIKYINNHKIIVVILIIYLLIVLNMIFKTIKLSFLFFLQSLLISIYSFCFFQEYGTFIWYLLKNTLLIITIPIYKGYITALPVLIFLLAILILILRFLILVNFLLKLICLLYLKIMNVNGTIYLFIRDTIFWTIIFFFFFKWYGDFIWYVSIDFFIFLRSEICLFLHVFNTFYWYHLHWQFLEGYFWNPYLFLPVMIPYFSNKYLKAGSVPIKKQLLFFFSLICLYIVFSFISSDNFLIIFKYFFDIDINNILIIFKSFFGIDISIKSNIDIKDLKTTIIWPFFRLCTGKNQNQSNQDMNSMYKNINKSDKTYLLMYKKINKYITNITFFRKETYLLMYKKINKYITTFFRKEIYILKYKEITSYITNNYFILLSFFRRELSILKKDKVYKKINNYITNKLSKDTYIDLYEEIEEYIIDIHSAFSNFFIDKIYLVLYEDFKEEMIDRYLDFLIYLEKDTYIWMYIDTYKYIFNTYFTFLNFLITKLLEKKQNYLLRYKEINNYVKNIYLISLKKNTYIIIYNYIKKYFFIFLNLFISDIKYTYAEIIKLNNNINSKEIYTYVFISFMLYYFL